MVCGSGSWPFNQTYTLNIPPEVNSIQSCFNFETLKKFEIFFQLERSVQRFTMFYSKQHSGRKLTWLNSLARGEIIAHCYDRKYTFTVSIFEP